MHYENKHVRVTCCPQVFEITEFFNIVLPKIGLYEFFIIANPVFQIAKLNPLVAPEKQILLMISPKTIES